MFTQFNCTSSGTNSTKSALIKDLGLSMTNLIHYEFTIESKLMYVPKGIDLVVWINASNEHVNYSVTF